MPVHAEAALAGRIEAALGSDGPVVAALRAAFPDALAVYAFGSRIQGSATEESDLDLAVLVAGYADPLRLWESAGDLAEMIGCEVDLLDFRAASTVMQYQILTRGRRLWADDLSADLYECFVLGEKQKLDEMREGLLADIARDGRIYGR